MESLLFGISPLDPLTLVVAPVLLLLAGLAACSVPAFRAARADPKTAPDACCSGRERGDVTAALQPSGCPAAAYGSSALGP